MRHCSSYVLLLLISSSLLILSCLSANELESTVSPKLARLQALEAQDGLIDLTSDPDALNSLVFQGPRDYTLIVSISSSSDRFRCPQCGVFDPVFKNVAQVHSTMEKKSNRLFFVRIDAGGLTKEMFTILSSKVQSLPFTFKLGPVKSKGLKFNFDDRSVYYQMSQDEVAFAVWVNSKTDVHIRIVNYQRMAMIATTLLMVAAIAYLKWDFFWNLAHNPLLYFTGAMIGYCVVVGGTVFNIIHKSPFFGYDRAGAVHWIIPNAREQFGAEGLIMAMIVGGGGLGWIILAGVMPTSKRPKWTIVVVLAITFALMLLGRRLFGWKHPYYPY